MTTKETLENDVVTRFAPSPTGLLHKGHAYSALKAYEYAKNRGGRFILRIEDIDTTRCKPDFIKAIYKDLSWLGIHWENPVRIQSQHLEDYQDILEQLRKRGLIYPCFCTRRDIQNEIMRSGHAPHGPEGPVYPGICKNIPETESAERVKNGEPHAWRLDLDKALTMIEKPIIWEDELHGLQVAKPELLGDIVLSRKDTPTSYHLSVTVDDALQGITHVVRGEDLFHATHIHVVLQKLLNLPQPIYRHHPLLLDSDGKRFAKRDKAETLTSIRENGVSAKEIIEEIMA
ncbi:tRNA glutamyl-Q(34) synthetase GluQRS [Kordiimonas sp. SCSIO 12610]|uniref:tRNA glutamyl-Q(34) synthetase GluQRS n=1 Tax=Kordiimonas sp. SCSIO 12610 TaxID=2829597 RepID=UPI00210C83E5|nr:tRNA glutamyl-Q(34) synthetase GluQRS [Kordiimonas sp. SCSIO 12610]UTW55134.1 tRNA glutamyl-Q(34) synthetase GluQRS [Kordiimonas sp. SCSIO 12610]